MSSFLSKTLAGLKATQLSKLYSLCGIAGAPSTKELKATHLAQCLRGSFFRNHDKRSARVLSVDMGIRNLAWCALDVQWPAQRAVEQRETWLDALEHVSLAAWTRLDVAAHASALDLAPPSAPPPAGEDVLNPQIFAPQPLSRLAHSILHTHLLPLSPTHLLIERQRYRSGGHAAVQEWTIRVNALEACLWGVITAEQQRSQGERVKAASVLPKAVSRFWLEGCAGVPGAVGMGVLSASRESGARDTKAGAQVATKRTSATDKQARTRLVHAWLTTTSHSSLPVASTARETSKAFIKGVEARFGDSTTATKPTRGKGLVADEQRLTKLDDLADCCAQGVAGVQWELNRRAVMGWAGDGGDEDVGRAREGIVGLLEG